MPSSPRPSATRRTPSRRRLPAWLAAAALVTALAAAGALWWRGRPAAPRPTATAEPPAALPPGEAYARALALGREGRHLASVPYFRRALAGLARDFPEIHVNHATALFNASLEFRGGVLAVPVTRSSDQRAAFVREALAELERARALVDDGPARARLLAREAEMLGWWGFATAAQERDLAAAAEDPAWPDPARRAARRAAILARPTLEDPTP
jgi:hypothetical protein